MAGQAQVVGGTLYMYMSVLEPLRKRVVKIRCEIVRLGPKTHFRHLLGFL